MSRFAPSDGPLPTSLSQGVNDGEIHREIHTADLFDDPAATAPAEGFSKPSPLKAASPSDLDASSLPDKATRLTDEAPGDDGRYKEDAEAGWGPQWSLASNPRVTNGAVGFGIRSGSQGTADIWTGAPKHSSKVDIEELQPQGL